MPAGDARFTGRTASEAAALLQQARARGAVNRSIDPTATQERAVRRVDNGVDAQGSDVAEHGAEVRGHEARSIEARISFMKSETETLEEFFAAINRNDMQAVVQDFDPEIVRIEPEGFPTAGTYRGIAEVQAHIRKGRGTWAEGTCNPEKFLVNGKKVVVYLHAWVRLKETNEWIGGRFADGFEFRDGRIIRYLSFGERADALEWADIKD
jgi:uncharacterized protein